MLNYFGCGVYQRNFLSDVELCLFFGNEIFVDIPTVVCIWVQYIENCTVPIIVLAGSYQFSRHGCGIVPHGLLSPLLIPVGVKDYR